MQEVGGQTHQNPSGNELPHPSTHVAPKNPIKANYNYLRQPTIINTSVHIY